MIPKPNDTGSLRPQELEAIYAISNVVAEAVDIDTALDTIVGLARPVFIFDNAVLYQKGEENGTLEATFARAIGRGRSSEADLAWGEVAAKEAIDTAQNYLNEPKIQEGTDRLDQRFYLGLPMMVGGKVIGALVFIRFGGPPFTDDQINLATFLQRETPKQHRGRIFAWLGTFVAPLSLLSVFCGPLAADAVGVVSVLALSGLLELVVGLLGWASLPKPLVRSAVATETEGLAEEKREMAGEA